MRGGGAFTDSCVESLSLPETIQTIDDEALKGVSSLKHVKISPKCEGFVSLDGMIFSKDYSHLLLIPEGKEGAIAIPGSTTHVSAQALSLCHSGSSLTTGDGSTNFTSHDRMLFSKDMKTLVAVPPAYGTAVVLPNETESIGEYALAGCKDIASITALGNVQSINPTAFADEVKATAVVALPAGEDYKVRKAVWENAGFENFAEPAQPGTTTSPNTNNEATSGLTYTLLDDYTLAVSWQGKGDLEANLEIPASAEINGVPYRVSTIAENAFANRGSLTSAKLPATITTINTAAFAGCANLAAIEFPNTLRSIGERAFEATSLKAVWLPASINSIGSRAFASCSSLERVVALGTPKVATDALAGCTNVSIYIPSGSEDSWNPGLPSDNNHLMSYGVTLSEEPLAIEAGQEANLLEGGNLQAPDPIEASYSYAAAPLSVDAGTVSAKKAGTSDVTAVLSLDGVELTRASRTVEVSPNPDAESNIALMSAASSLPAAYLADARNNQISVTAPTRVTLGDGDGYDVATKPECATGTAIFKNNSTGQSVQLNSVKCTNISVENNIETLDTSRSLDSQRLFSLYPKGNEDAAVSFGYGTGVNSATPTDKDAFGIASSASAPYTFRLNLTNKIELANAKVMEDDVTSSGKTVSLATVMCTFAGFTFTPTGHGDKNDNFYLRDVGTDTFYSLADVKAHANDISNKGKGSLYYSMYEGYVADDVKYECKTTWGTTETTTYDLLIIDVLHDDKASGGKAGLTFQFKDLLSGTYQMNIAPNTNVGGWGQSQLRARMNPASLPNQDNVIANSASDDDVIWDLVPAELQNSIEVVKKPYNPTRTDIEGNSITTSNDKLFLASLVELRGIGSGSGLDSSYPWTIKEGSQYAYWDYKNVVSGNNACLTKAVLWWERSVHTNYSNVFFCVGSNGDPSSTLSAGLAYGVCPCFCL